VVGYLAMSQSDIRTFSYNCVLGYYAARGPIGNLSGNVFVGAFAGETCSTNSSVIIGYMAGRGLTSSNICAIGESSITSANYADYGTFLGYRTGFSGSNLTRSVLVGGLAGSRVINLIDSVCIGYDCGPTTDALSGVVAIGNQGIRPTASYQLVIGPCYSGFLGNGVLSSSPWNFTLSATKGSGTNIGGADFRVAGGAATGSGTPGRVILATSQVGAAGSNEQTLVDRMWIGKAGEIILNKVDSDPSNPSSNNVALFLKVSGTSPKTLYLCARFENSSETVLAQTTV